ncbi:MAG: AraC family transcriptional regulator [Steroidobacteraceae bacterium]
MSTPRKARYAQRISKVLDYISQHLDEELSLDTLCQLANFSRFHFHRQFSAYTGISLGRMVQLQRLRRAALQLVFARDLSVTDIAFAAGFANAESFARAFRKECGQSPSSFRKAPTWQQWQVRMILDNPQETADMQVEIVDFPETLVAALEHRGPEHLTYQTSQKFIEWRRANGVKPGQGNTYGVHYTDHLSVLPENYRLDLCVSIAQPVAENPQGVVTKVIPAGRCARVRNIGTRHELPGPRYLYETWLPQSGEQLRDYPMFFHYVNVGPGVKEHEMITDIYLPLR